MANGMASLMVGASGLKTSQTALNKIGRAHV